MLTILAETPNQDNYEAALRFLNDNQVEYEEVNLMNADIVALLGEGFIETVIMVIGSGILGSIIGIPLGVLLHVTR